MSTQTIDYDALARQHGAISSQPAVSSGPGQIDYDALAKQHGAISSDAATRPMATMTGPQMQQTAVQQLTSPPAVQRVIEPIKGFARGVRNVVGGVGEMMKPRGPEEVQAGP